MVQITETEDPYEDPYYVYKALDTELQQWEKLGNIGLFSSAFVGGAACIPAAMKKRVYTFQSTGAPGAPAQAEAAVVEEVVAGVVPAPRCSPEERAKIVELFTSIADGGANLALPWVGYRLYQLGNEIRHVHTFALLQAMPKEKIRQTFIEASEFKMGKILNGISEGMQREIQRNNVNRYIPGLATAMGKEETPIRQLIQAADWLGLVRYLFEIPAAHAG
jgi:hypothetical protein